MLSHRVTGRVLTLGKAYEVNIDVSDSLDPVTKADFKVDFASDHHTGKWKLLDKKNSIVSVRFMGKLFWFRSNNNHPLSSTTGIIQTWHYG